MLRCKILLYIFTKVRKNIWLLLALEIQLLAIFLYPITTRDSFQRFNVYSRETR